MRHGEYAALIAGKTIKAWYGKRCRVSEESLQSFIDAANHLMCKESNRLSTRMGSTCTVIEEQNGYVRNWNLGDSRTYLYHDGKLHQLSEDHTEARSMERLNLNVTPWLQLEIGDMILLCSDGLTHMVSDEGIENYLSTKQTIEKRQSGLVNLALEKGGRDNITVILIEVV